jgi:hypothetical protein
MEESRNNRESITLPARAHKGDKMKRYNELTPDEKTLVFDKECKNILDAALDDVFPELEDEIKKAADIAESNQTPWFFQAILYHEIPGAKEKIDAIIQDNIENALFIEKHEYAINL